MTTQTMPIELQRMIDHLARLAEVSGGLPDAETPAGMLVREFLQNSWSRCRDELLTKTNVLRVRPQPGPAPSVFHFEIDCAYKRKSGPDAPVELMPGPVRGTIHYRSDMFANPDLPYIAAQIDPSLEYFHPNCSRQRGGLLCLGEIPGAAFPFPLDLLLENHLYPIVTYQNRRPAHAFDEEAARYFALDPDAMEGLQQPAKPLY